MSASELKNALQSKINEFEVAMELGKPHIELRELYKQIKELQYQIAIAEAIEREAPQESVSYSHFSTSQSK